MIPISRPKQLLAGLLAFAAIGHAADYSSWSSYRPVILNTTGMTLSASVTNIPILVRFTAAAHKDMLDSTTQVQADGSDIRVTKADGVTDVPFEIEHLSTGATGKLHIWILAENVDASSAAAATFRVYWGKTGETSMSNGAAVFSTTNGYQAAFHMSDTSAASVKDIANGYTGTAVGTAISTEAMTGTARTFSTNGGGNADPTVTSNYIHFQPGATDPLSTHTGPITMEAWVRSSITQNSNTSAGTKTIISHKNDSAEAVWLKRNGVTTAGNQRYAAGGDTTNANGPAVPTGEANAWHYVVGSWDGTAWTVVRQRTSDSWGSTGLPAPSMVRTVGGGAPVASTDPWFIGGWSDDGTATGVITRGWRGQIDEVRISTVARDSNYLELSFETTKLTANALTIGPTEVPPPPVAGTYEDWTGHHDIVLNTSATGANVAGDVTNFPVLVRLGTAELSIIGAANGGNSIRFSKADDATALPYQIESWSGTAAAIWVKVDTIYGNNSTQKIRMHYGNPAAASESNGAAVFDTLAGFTGVWHMNGTAGETDATGNALTADQTGTVPSAVGITGNARSFSTTANYLKVTGSASSKLNYEAGSNYTLSAWVYSDSITTANGNGHGILNKGNDQYGMGIYGDANKHYDIMTRGNNSWNQAATNASGNELTAQSGVGTWRLITGTWTGAGTPQDTGRIYVNGVLYNTTFFNDIANTGSGRNLTHDVHIGVLGGGSVSRAFIGRIDEVTASSVARDSNWIKLSYESQKAANTLTNIGLPVYTVPGQPTGVTAVAGDASATVTWVAPANDGGKPITGYRAEVSNNDALFCTTTGALSCTVTGLNNGTFYTFVVKAENEVGFGAPSGATAPPTEPTAPAPTVGLYTDWSGHRTITTNTKASGANIPVDVTNFPVLVRLGSAESAILTAAKADGSDIRFSMRNDSTALPYQIESWSPTAATIWVKLDVVEGNDSLAAFRLHYGNANANSQSNGPAVFDTTNGFVAVWHMNEASGNLTDATGKGNTAIASAAAPGDTTGPLGGAKKFDGATNWYQIGTDSNAVNLDVDAPSGLTISAWVNPTSCDARIAAFSKYVNGSEPAGRQYSLHTGNTSTNWRFTVGSPTVGTGEFFTDAEATCVTGTWKHVVGTYASAGPATEDSAVNVRIYVDGALMGSGSLATIAGVGVGANTYIGRIHNDQRYMNGLLDEITVSAVRRDSNWIKLSYESQKLMQAFTNIGVTLPSVPTAPQSVTALSAGTVGSVNVYWSAPTSNGGANITKYVVTGAPSGTCETTGALTCTVTGLTAGSYTFTVTATNSAGVSPASAASAPFTVTGIALPGAFTIHMDGASKPYTYRLPTDAISLTEKLSMTIVDVQGKQVWTRTINPASAKVGEITWNGKTAKGQAVAPGMYIVRLRAEMGGKVIEAVRGNVKH